MTLVQGPHKEKFNLFSMLHARNLMGAKLNNQLALGRIGSLVATSTTFRGVHPESTVIPTILKTSGRRSGPKWDGNYTWIPPVKRRGEDKIGEPFSEQRIDLNIHVLNKIELRHSRAIPFGSRSRIVWRGISVPAFPGGSCQDR